MCDCKKPNPARHNANECFICGELLSQEQMESAFLDTTKKESWETWKPTLERVMDLEKENTKLRSRVADLEEVVDEIPNLGALFQAVQELQELHEAPASKFTHFVGGSRY